MLLNLNEIGFPPATTIESKLQAVRIFLNTALFDKIERDKEGKMPINQVIIILLLGNGLDFKYHIYLAE